MIYASPPQLLGWVPMSQAPLDLAGILLPGEEGPATVGALNVGGCRSFRVDDHCQDRLESWGGGS